MESAERRRRPCYSEVLVPLFFGCLNTPRERRDAVSERLGEVLGGPERATVILDPPAQGLDARVIDLLAGAPVDRLVFISCDPATLARDLKFLAPYYTLESATPFDMFPQTAEIEVLAILTPRA
jgi:23S rRNA (uracil1939-C5)-methyltransferase